MLRSRCTSAVGVDRSAWVKHVEGDRELTVSIARSRWAIDHDTAGADAIVESEQLYRKLAYAGFQGFRVIGVAEGDLHGGHDEFVHSDLL